MTDEPQDTSAEAESSDEGRSGSGCTTCCSATRSSCRCSRGGEARHILIDVGNVTGHGGDVDVFKPVLEDIFRELDGQPLDLYVMTHEHMDHVKGLLYAQDKLGLDSKTDPPGEASLADGLVGGGLLRRARRRQEEETGVRRDPPGRETVPDRLARPEEPGHQGFRRHGG